MKLFVALMKNSWCCYSYLNKWENVSNLLLWTHLAEIGTTGRLKQSYLLIFANFTWIALSIVDLSIFESNILNFFLNELSKQWFNAL